MPTASQNPYSVIERSQVQPVAPTAGSPLQKRVLALEAQVVRTSRGSRGGCGTGGRRSPGSSPGLAICSSPVVTGFSQVPRFSWYQPWYRGPRHGVHR